MIHKRTTALERSVKILLLEGLNRFNGANLTLNSDVDQESILENNIKRGTKIMVRLTPSIV